MLLVPHQDFVWESVAAQLPAPEGRCLYGWVNMTIFILIYGYIISDTMNVWGYVVYVHLLQCSFFLF